MKCNPAVVALFVGALLSHSLDSAFETDEWWIESRLGPQFIYNVESLNKKGDIDPLYI